MGCPSHGMARRPARARVRARVGPVLIAINHGGALLRGDISGGQLLQMALTLMVPYAVSTLSSA